MNKLDKVKRIVIQKTLKLDCGKSISNFPIAYETYGRLNENKDNAILVFHALTGDQFASGVNPVTNKEGWWSYAVGSGKAIDTNKYFVICANVLGGCMGSYGPSDINPENKKIFGTDFPVITINDMVNAQYELLAHLKIEKLFSVIGGSMGGMQVLQFISNFPDKSHTAIPIACTASHSAQNIALNELGRQSIMADSDWQNGFYEEKINLLQRDCLLLGWRHILRIYPKKVYRKNLEGNFKKEMTLNLALMQIFKLKAI